MKTINQARIFTHNKLPISPEKDYVLYWMQAAVRTKDNHALYYALTQCQRLKKPLVVYFALCANYPHANARHYHFLLQGLCDVAEALKEHDIAFVIRLEDPISGVLEISKRAAMIITDNGALRIQRQWRDQIATAAAVQMISIETNLVVPIWVASNKEEYAARTIRPKILKHLELFKDLPSHYPWRAGTSNLCFSGIDLSNIDKIISSLPIDKQVLPSAFFKGGEKEAQKQLKHFVREQLALYQKERSNPGSDCTSKLSPYLHFGHISPLTIVKTLSGHKGTAGYIEELIVRRELAFNYVWFNSYYDQFRALPLWAQETLEAHQADDRNFNYTLEQLEMAQPHDPYWNACQNEMRITGFMHGYMRMYWGKKIIEWSRDPKQAFQWLIYLNDKYQLDGRDANSYCGIAWCFGKHDRPWTRRPIFGTIRYMNAQGLKRKFDMEKYVMRIEELKKYRLL